MKKVYVYMLAVIIAASSCQTGGDNSEVDEKVGIDVSNMDINLDPKNDFYRFANGNWLDKTEIPADQGRWGGFPELSKRNNKMVLGILEEAAKDPKYSEGSDERKAIDFFSVGMDSLHAEQVGVNAVKGWYDRIDNASSKEEIQSILSDLHKSGYNAFHNSSSFADLMKSDINAFYLDAGGLGLPNRDYYTKEDSKSKEIREKYVVHVAKMLELSNAGEEDFMASAGTVMGLETRIANSSLTPVERRNIPALYNKMTVSEIQEMSPSVDWTTYLSSIGANVDTVIVLEPKFLGEVSAIMSDYSVDDLKPYLKWCVINRASPYMNNELVQTDFDFYGKVIRGTEELRPRWERVLGSTNQAIGEALGKVYVAETFPPEAKKNAEEMVNNILKAFDGRIKNLEWMSDETKEQALKKLGTFTVKIGYPNEWRDYSGLEVSSSGETYSFINNVENSSRYEFKRNIERIGEPVDKEEWQMNPQTVNAYYNPLNNEIVFPAAILQPPFYDYRADPGVNYGGMGAVIGHEISHGFDDQGSRFDSEGNMVNWWTDQDREQFNSRTDLLVAQFDAYEPLDSVFVQGQLTLGENIGDLGGLNAAYDGLQIHFQNNEKPGPIDGFTQEQRFFISWATIWRTKYRDETLRTQILTDPHSPGMYRAVGPLENIETFYSAFDVKEGDNMWKPDSLRVKIW